MPSSNTGVSSGPNDESFGECRYDNDTPPSVAIVRAIAAIEDVDPRESPDTLGIALHDHLDSAALDRLVAGTDGDDAVDVDLTLNNGHRYDVQIRDAGRVVVEKTF
ncbi:HalOD1 output domain-containing protein [Halovivax sp.]|uniref:HalOD1 output domain-containing protein n=1 Tax=Halovivax sp. TaxID=1935978 RepID=UPI0025BAEA82|nr:HalOD1 output domain-containing protein [Halovivax sp.]